MANDIWNIFLNLVAAFIYAGIVWLWQQRSSRPSPSPRENTPPPQGSEPVHDNRSEKRRVIARAAYMFLFYFVTFAALYFSITLPPLFKALFSKTEVLLSNAHFVGEFLPAIPIGKDYLQITFFAIAAVIYFPLLILAEFVTSHLYPIINTFVVVTNRIWSTISAFIFLALCVPIAATSVWLFYEKTFQESLVIVFFAILVFFAIGLAQGGKK